MTSDQMITPFPTFVRRRSLGSADKINCEKTMIRPRRGFPAEIFGPGQDDGKLPGCRI